MVQGAQPWIPSDKTLNIALSLAECMSWDSLPDQFKQQLVPPRELCALLFVSGITVISTKSHVFGKRKFGPAYSEKRLFWWYHILTNILFGTLNKCHGLLASKQLYYKVSFGHLKAVNSVRFSSHHSSPWQPCLWIITAPLGTSLSSFESSPFSLLSIAPSSPLCVAPLELSCSCP